MQPDDCTNKVSLSTRRLRVLPPTVLHDTGVESLNLDRNKLRHVTGISKLYNLKKVILSKNEITDFPEEIQSLVHLEKLELNQNQIRLIPEGIFSCLPRLKHLRLNNNRLSTLPKDLASCSGSLQYLNLSNNLFRAIPQPVLELVSLQELYVQNNSLRQLPRELFEGRPLKMFKANGNPLREPPNEVCAGGIHGEVTLPRSHFDTWARTKGSQSAVQCPIDKACCLPSLQCDCLSPGGQTPFT
uniref:Uncharacterized protein n=1 Tax=Pelusios castaneus TaxID=367368 RepID=A0A8C8S2C6_9SAUR